MWQQDVIIQGTVAKLLGTQPAKHADLAKKKGWRKDRLLPESQHLLNQLLRQVFINAVVTAANGGVEAEVGEEVFGDLGDFGEDELDFDLIWKLSGPHFGDEVLAAVAGGLPEAEESADFVVMEQTVVTCFDLHWPRLVGPEQVLVHAV